MVLPAVVWLSPTAKVPPVQIHYIVKMENLDSKNEIGNMNEKLKDVFEF